MLRAHHDAVLAYALRRATADDARDVMADTFLVAWRRFDEASRDRPRAWLYGVARRVLANRRRAVRRQTSLVHRLESTVAGPSAGDGLILDALATLSDGDREVLLLVAWEGLSVTDAALVLGCRIATARMRLHRARRRLAAQLSDPAPDVRAPSMEPTS
ncbi:MAG TPA: sigma-70 family RNA polymerase sigma factor [Solirubrobacteraceae bacterium]|nr:sigma-70 family RNA polymerase sigma factor [Solirubrobacteraceae bacterium]